MSKKLSALGGPIMLAAAALTVLGGTTAAGAAPTQNDGGHTLGIVSRSQPTYTDKQLRQACMNAAVQMRVRCIGKGKIGEICSNSWGLPARFGDLAYDRRGLLYCWQYPDGFVGAWRRY